jgi:LemA protein
MSITTIVVLAVIAGLTVYAISLYNGLVAARNRFKNAFAQIDVQLQRRYELIPNLVEAAKAYLQHERETLEAVIAARNQAQSAAKSAAASPGDAQAIHSLGAAEGVLGGALGRFFALSEAYPDLKADGTVNGLMEELTTTENKVAFARQHFNDAVMDYNIRREQFPDTILAGMFNFCPAELLQIDDPEARKALKISMT